MGRNGVVMPLRTAAIALGSGALIFGALSPMTASAEEPSDPAPSDEILVPDAPDAPVAAPTAPGRPKATVARWDWSMPAQLKDNKVWEVVTDPASPDYLDGGRYIKN